MPKATSYGEIRNPLIVISFNGRAGEHGQSIQPVIINVRCEAITTEGAVRNININVPVGDVRTEPLTPKQMYTAINKTTVGAILASAFKDALMEALTEDMTV